MALIFAGILGLFASLLINYLSDVLPTQRKLARPACQECGNIFDWRDYLLMIPCRKCGKPRSWRTYIVLVAGIVISIAMWLSRPAWMEYWLAILIATFLGLVIIIDIEYRLILHVVTIAGSVLGLVTGLSRFSGARTLLGGLSGLLIMLVLYGLGVLFARIRARKLGVDDGEEALGFGDVTISGVLGLMVGFPNIFYGLVTGILFAGIFSILLILSLVLRKKFESAAIYIAYGPFLILGSVIYIFFR
jgi:leader peptidase (prepilin peptidase)/N-methyltransferase